MPLNQNAIDELKEIYLREFGVILTDQEAWDMGINLVNIFKAISNYCRGLKVESKDGLTDHGSDL